MSESLILYATSKFDSENVPISEDVLNTNSTRYNIELIDLNDSTSPVRSIRFDRSVSQIPANVIDKIQYVKSVTGGIYYEVTGRQFFSTNIVELSMQMTPFLNGWIASSKVSTGLNITGMIDRESHKDGDPINLLSEPFSPLEPIKTTVIGDYPVVDSLLNHEFVLSTIDLFTSKCIRKNKQILVSYTSDDKIASYEIQPAEVDDAPTTKFFINSPFNELTSQTWSYAGLGVYDGVKSYTMNLLNALGLTNAVIDRWTVPSDYINITETKGDYGYRVSRLEGKNLAVKPLNLADTIGTITHTTEEGAGVTYTVKNEKAKYYSLILHILSKVSGDQKSFRWVDITNPTNVNTATLGALADPSPDGAPYCYSTFYKGAKQYELWSLTSVRGGSWVKPSMVYRGKTGRLITDFQTTEQLVNNNQQSITGTVGSAIGAVGGILTGNALAVGSGVGNILGNLWGSLNQEAQIKNARNLSNALYTPTYSPADMGSLAGAMPNNFTIYSTRWGDEDIYNFDQFLTNYGWAQNKCFSNNLLWNELDGRGDAFTYIRFSDINITADSPTSSQTSRFLQDITAERLLSGVRFWRS